MSTPIRVHGFIGEVTQSMLDEASRADLVVGGDRHLDALGVEQARRIRLGALSAAVERIVAAGPEARIMVVASGDPGWFGIVRRLREAGLPVRVLPAPTSISLAFAAVGIPWDDAEVVSIHGRPLEPALAVCRAWGKVAVMTGPDQGIVELATHLADLDREFWLCERLGEDDERVRLLDAAQAMALDEVADPNVVLVVDPHLASTVGWHQGAPRPAGPPPRVSDEAARIFCRTMPGRGDVVRVRGPISREVAALARHNGAAVIEVEEQ